MIRNDVMTIIRATIPIVATVTIRLTIHHVTNKYVSLPVEHQVMATLTRWLTPNLPPSP